MAAERIPVWVDCDPGHDDAFALLLASHHPFLRLLGVSTVHGNASVEATTANALSVLAAIGRSDVPVYQGASAPLKRARNGAEEFHGATGLAGTERLPSIPCTAANTSMSAAEAIYTAVTAEPPNHVWLVAIGPLTNVANLLHDRPEIIDRIAGLSVMGGALGGGYTTAKLGKEGDTGELVNYPNSWAEFNVWCDPEAAAVVLGDPRLASKTTLVTLDLSHQVLADLSAQSVLFGETVGGEPSRPNQNGNVKALFEDLLRHSCSTYQRRYSSLPGPPLHDPITVLLLLPACRVPGRDEYWRIHVVVQEESKQLGRTIGIPVEQYQGTWVPKRVEQDLLWKILKNALDAAAASAKGENE